MSAETNRKTKAWVQNLYAAECQRELVRDDLLVLARDTVDSGWKDILKGDKKSTALQAI